MGEQERILADAGLSGQTEQTDSAKRKKNRSWSSFHNHFRSREKEEAMVLCRGTNQRRKRQIIEELT